MKPITLIVSGTGKTGKRLAARMNRLGLPTRIGSRSGTPPFDWTVPHSWPAVLRDVGAVYIAYYPDLAFPGAAGHIGAFVDEARRSGVRQLVLLSGRGEPAVGPSERAIVESGLEYTILRAAWLNQNFTEGHLADGIQSGELAFPGGSVAEPFVDADDIADVALAALSDDEHAGRTYDLTGPRLLTFAEATAEIAAASGKPIRYTAIDSATYAEALRPYLPAEQLAFLVELFANVLDGHNAHLSDGVERALGRPPRDFADFARTPA